MAGQRKPPMAIEVVCPDCGSIFDHLPHGKQKPRSPEQHRRFFLMCTLAYRNWPDRDKFFDAEDCRYWLTMKASPHYREVAGRIRIPEGFGRREAQLMVREAFRNAKTYEWPQVEGREIVIYRARSVAFLNMSHSTFNALNSLVQEVIEQEGGLDVEKLIEAHFKEKAARGNTQRERAPKYLDRDF